MKKISLLLLVLAVISCNAYSSITDGTYLGMTKQEFISKVKYPKLDSASEGVEVYRTSKRVVRAGFAQTETHFFYFRNGKLIKIGQGVRQTDHRQRIDVNVNNN